MEISRETIKDIAQAWIASTEGQDNSAEAFEELVAKIWVAADQAERIASFQANVEQWSRAREIYKYSDAKAQALKAVSELGELSDAIIKGEKKAAEDAIGDTAVCLVNVAALLGLSFNDCCDAAWHEIKDRKGHMVKGGAFVKEG